MKGKDEIKELFSDKLGGYEAPIGSHLWTNIASQIGGATSVVTSTGMSLLTKSIIGIGVISAVAVIAVIVISPTTEKKENVKTKAASIEFAVEVDAEKQEENLKEDNIKSQEIVAVDTVKDKPLPADQLSEIDQLQNFNSDVRLIEPLKEGPEENPTESKEQSNLKEEALEAPVAVQEEKTEKTPIRVNTQENNINKNEQVKAYTLEELPNIFTPNGDGNNDFLFIESEGLIDFNVVVLDVKHKVFYESNDPNFKWNGVDKFGNTVSAGNYIYYIVARDKNGNKVNKYVSLVIRL